MRLLLLAKNWLWKRLSLAPLEKTHKMSCNFKKVFRMRAALFVAEKMFVKMIWREKENKTLISYVQKYYIRISNLFSAHKICTEKQQKKKTTLNSRWFMLWIHDVFVFCSWHTHTHARIHRGRMFIRSFVLSYVCVCMLMAYCSANEKIWIVKIGPTLLHILLCI